MVRSYNWVTPTVEPHLQLGGSYGWVARTGCWRLTSMSGPCPRSVYPALLIPDRDKLARLVALLCLQARYRGHGPLLQWVIPTVEPHLRLGYTYS